MSYLAFNKSLARFLTEKASLETEKEVILTYAIEVLVINMGNILFTLILAALLGVLPGTLSCLVAAFLFRHTAGGAHSSSPWRCAAVTITIFPAMALLAVFLAQFGAAFIGILSTLTCLTGLITVAVLAPVDSPSAPIVSPDRRKKLKILSLVVFSLITAAIFFIPRSGWVYASQIQICLVLSVLWTSFMLSKPGHSVMFLIDKINLRRCKAQ